jgi:MFS family permease
VNTVIKMAVVFGRAIGLDSAGMLLALIVTQFVAFPAAILFGRIGERFGARRGILLGIAVYAGVCLFATRMNSPREFFAMAVVIGLVQGGVQSLSRSFFARIIPPEKGGEYFGFYNLLGKFAAVLGPTLMGVTALLTDARTSILALLVLVRRRRLAAQPGAGVSPPQALTPHSRSKRFRLSRSPTTRQRSSGASRRPGSGSRCRTGPPSSTPATGRITNTTLTR